MDILLTTTQFRTLGESAINYGEDDYGTQTYSCEENSANCSPAEAGGNTNTGTVATPNTGFFGMNQDTAFIAIGGGALVLLAIACAAIFVAVKARKNKQTTNEQGK